MRCGLVVAIVFSLSQSGCIVTLDTLSRFTPNPGPTRTPGTSLPVRAGPSVREVKLDPDHGLVCANVDTSIVRSTWTETDVVNPNGVQGLVIMLTALEGTAFALAEWKGDAPLHNPYFVVPVALDVAWGIYRSITIHPEVVRGARVSVDDGEHPGSTTSAPVPCPVGTEIVLAGDGETLVAHTGSGGWLDPVEIPALIAFLTAHPDVRLSGGGVGSDVKFDASAARAIVAKARRQAEEAPPAPSGAPPPPGPPASPPRVIIRVDPDGRPHVYEVPVRPTDRP